MILEETVDILDLRIDNPYSTGEILTLNDEIMLERKEFIYKKSSLDRIYQVTDGDLIWDIAYQSWNNSKLWWIIWDVNNSIEDPFKLETGLNLIIPDLNSAFIQNFS